MPHTKDNTPRPRPMGARRLRWQADMRMENDDPPEDCPDGWEPVADLRGEWCPVMAIRVDAEFTYILWRRLLIRSPCSTRRARGRA